MTSATRRVGRTRTFVAIAVLLSACTHAEARGGAASLPGPVPSGVSFSGGPSSAPRAPDFSLMLVDGTPVTGSELWEERPLVLSFFASWCGRCAEQQGDLTSLSERYRDAVVFLGVAGSDEPDAVLAYLNEHEVPYAVALDAELTVWRSYAVREPPHIAVVAKGGRLVRGWPGGIAGAVIADTLDELVIRPT
ncbi:MAG: TlpA family protein disulfide reductase [Actinomycetota bacterium]|nr:TlpA family protein disulfide reductase [Actinomycetota bacterium]